ncbi:MAG: UDP-N-acetylmuramate dehydrogenase [Xanthomonadales bacterium]|jgi:UDP-N-acetylmuramate dehydrogenase|nr:UDP-N-acetylmuramate dehydrogenase [Xanthomonadales bacterium]
MKVFEGPSLRGMNSLGLEASADLLIAIETEEDVIDLPRFNPEQDCILGGGSNIVFATDVPGTVYHNRILGKDIIEHNSEHAVVEVGAGENWHQLVVWSLDQGLSGLENLSLIPGQTGAAPIQNIGAYGVELSSVLHGVTAWDWQQSLWVYFEPGECALGYRDSLFKAMAADRYLITSIRLKLNRNFRPRLGYSGLREELSAMGVENVTAPAVSDAVIRLRRRKLPDPAMTGNAGSFFKNPVVGPGQADTLKSAHPDLPLWPLGDGRAKLSAAWMIELCGLKGLRLGDAAVSGQHALVLINLGSASGKEIVELAHKVQSTVADRFGIVLEPEPRLVEFDA